ncbi:hypothetical protein EVG20_g4970 [Dentipellis fragilis]|uniref:Uncharacterized protein n=1 Tax=Dentipellis fragilis TaxID=205917 RepID=A0A4Y9YYB5_9AGAM|nr:hypothetical protein EVG20_g4970 [Dentipellis fragilis]
MHEMLIVESAESARKLGDALDMEPIFKEDPPRETAVDLGIEGLHGANSSLWKLALQALEKLPQLETLVIPYTNPSDPLEVPLQKIRAAHLRRLTTSGRAYLLMAANMTQFDLLSLLEIHLTAIQFDLNSTTIFGATMQQTSTDGGALNDKVVSLCFKHPALWHPPFMDFMFDFLGLFLHLRAICVRVTDIESPIQRLHHPSLATIVLVPHIENLDHQGIESNAYRTFRYCEDAVKIILEGNLPMLRNVWLLKRVLPAYDKPQASLERARERLMFRGITLDVNRVWFEEDPDPIPTVV